MKQFGRLRVSLVEGNMITERQFREQEVQIARYRLLERAPTQIWIRKILIINAMLSLRVEQSVRSAHT